MPYIQLEKPLNHRLVLKKVRRVFKFNQGAWLKPYTNLKTEIRKNAKNDFEFFFFKLMNNAVFRKNSEFFFFQIIY